MKTLTKAQKIKFLNLVEDVNSRDGGTRVIGRIRMGAFTREHGEDVCKAFYDEYNELLKKRGKKKS